MAWDDFYGMPSTHSIPVRFTDREWDALCATWMDHAGGWPAGNPPRPFQFHRFDIEFWCEEVTGPYEFWAGCTITSPDIPQYRGECAKRFGPHKNPQRTFDKARSYLVERGLLEIIAKDATP